MQIGTMAAGVAVSDMDDRSRMAVMGALGMGTQYGIMRPFSRDHESVRIPSDVDQHSELMSITIPK